MNAVLVDSGFGNWLVRKFVGGSSAKATERQKPARKATRAASRDRISRRDHCAMLDRLKRGSDVRMDKVATIRAQVTLASYDEEAKLDIAVDRLLDDLLNMPSGA